MPGNRRIPRSVWSLQGRRVAGTGPATGGSRRGGVGRFGRPV